MLQPWILFSLMPVLVFLLVFSRDGLLHVELEQILERIPAPHQSNSIDAFVTINEALDSFLYDNHGTITFRDSLVREATGFLVRCSNPHSSLPPPDPRRGRFEWLFQPSTP